jgi:hypothetical protein
VFHFFLLATENRLPTTSPAGGLFSVTLSVTRDSHPKYPRFHKACCPSVFGLSSGEKFTPAITCHSAEDIIEEECVQRSALNVQRSAARHIGRGPPGSCASPIELELELGFSSAGGGADGKQPRFQRSPFAITVRRAGNGLQYCLQGLAMRLPLGGESSISDETGEICVTLPVRFPWVFRRDC